jgi:hypothetical protein
MIAENDEGMMKIRCRFDKDGEWEKPNPPPAGGS